MPCWYREAAALTAAVKLDIFTLIGGGAVSSDALAEKTAASSRGTRIVCELLTTIGLLAKQHGAYTPRAEEIFDRSSPAWIGGAIEFFAAPEMVRLMLDDPVSYVRHGGSAGLAHLAPDHPIWLRYAKAAIHIARVQPSAPPFISLQGTRP